MIPFDIQNRQVENYPETHHHVLPEQMQEGLKYHFGQQINLNLSVFLSIPRFFPGKSTCCFAVEETCVFEGLEESVNLGFPPHSVGFKGCAACFAMPACGFIPPGLLCK